MLFSKRRNSLRQASSLVVFDLHLPCILVSLNYHFLSPYKAFLWKQVAFKCKSSVRSNAVVPIWQVFRKTQKRVRYVYMRYVRTIRLCYSNSSAHAFDGKWLVSKLVSKSCFYRFCSDDTVLSNVPDTFALLYGLMSYEFVFFTVSIVLYDFEFIFVVHFIHTRKPEVRLVLYEQKYCIFLKLKMLS